MEFLLYTGALALGFFCVLVVLVILMQRPSANAGMGASLGGGAAESAFGGEAGNVLTKTTAVLMAIIFSLSLGLFLGFKSLYGKKSGKASTVMDELAKPAATAPATPGAPSPAPATGPAPKTVTPASSAPSVPAATSQAQPLPAQPAKNEVPSAATPAKK